MKDTRPDNVDEKSEDATRTDSRNNNDNLVGKEDSFPPQEQLKNSYDGDAPSVAMTEPSSRASSKSLVEEEQNTLEAPSSAQSASSRGVVTLSASELLAITANEEEDLTSSLLFSIIDREEEAHAATNDKAKDRKSLFEDTASKQRSDSSKGTASTAAGAGGSASVSSSMQQGTGSVVSLAPGAHRVGNSNEKLCADESEQGFKAVEENDEAVKAMIVDHDEYEAQIRRQVLSEAVVAQVVDGDPQNAKDDRAASATSEKEQPPAETSRKWTWIMLLVIVVLVVAIVLGVTLSGSNSEDDAQLQQMPEQEFEADSPEQELLDSEGDNEEEEIPATTIQVEGGIPSWWVELSPGITEQGSPQQQAYVWMVDNDKASMDLSEPPIVFSFWRTYALTTFYYSTGGENWTRSDDWLDPDVNSCDWYPGNMCDRRTDRDRNLRSRNLQGRLFKRIALPNNGLVGKLPEELSLLTDMELLDVSFNELEGSLKLVAGELFQNGLLDLRLEGNLFTDRIQPVVCNSFVDFAKPQNGTFAMDCLETADGAEDWEVRCPCCNLCCSADGLECQENDEEKPGTT